MKEGGTQSPSRSSAERNNSLATVRLLGNLGKLPNGKKVEIQKIIVPVTVGNLLEELQRSTGLELRRDSTLVLVNGVEANALQDLETVVVAGDEVALIPMFHGGAD
jgi:molybdopterin converting factor small subunit